MPAGVVVDLGAQADRAGRGPQGGLGIGGGIPADEIRPHHHRFALAEVTAIGDGLFLSLAAVRRQVGEGAQLLRDGDQLGPDWQAVEPRHSQDARRDAKTVAGGQQRLHAGVPAGRVGGADQVGRGLCLGRTTGDAHHDRERVRLVGDGVERAGKRAFVAGLADVGLRVGQQDGGIEREGGHVGIVGGADDAGHGGLDGANGARAVVEFNDAHAVVVIGWHAVLQECP